MTELEDGYLQTPFGVLGGVFSYNTYSDGRTVKNVRLKEKNMIVTHAGELVPFYGDETPRSKFKPSLSFYENGLVKSVALERQQEVVTPIGEIPAEFISFYETGEVKRVFPLDGKITGFWSVEEEKNLNIPLSFDLGFTKFTALLSGICFYKSGDIRSITLFPDEKIEVCTAYGKIPVRIGFSLYESGALQSCEPAEPFAFSEGDGMAETAVVYAYDIKASGVNADVCSLKFDESGKIIDYVAANTVFDIFDGGDGCSPEDCANCSLCK